MSLKQFAGSAGLTGAGYKWLRRVTSSGLSHVHASGAVRLEKISEFISKKYPRRSEGGGFEYVQPSKVREVLLHDDLMLFLKRFREPKREPQSFRRVVESRGPLCTDAEACEMLNHLLESRRFDYLKCIVSDLHRGYYG
jgi:hypothetical protein